VFIIPSEQRFSESSVDQMGGDTNNLSRQLKTVDVNGGGTSKGWQAFQVIFWTWLSLATLIGNGLVLACVIMKKRRNSSTFKFYGSLALGDLLVGIFCAPVLLAVSFRQQWNMGDPLCQAYSTVISTSLNVSIMTLFLISLDRLNAVSKPFHYRAKETFTQKWTIWLILFAWAHSIFWAAAPLVGWGEIIKDDVTNSCKPNWAAEGLKNKLYTMGLAGFAFAIPVLSMIVVYAIIYYRSKVSSRFMKNRAHSTVSEDTARQKQQSAILRTVLVVVGMFALCWLPYTIATTFKLFFHKAPSSWLVHLGIMLAAANSSVNPVIYSAFDKTMRDEFKRICQICRRKRETVDDLDGGRSRRTSSNLATYNNTVTKISNETINKILKEGNFTESPATQRKDTISTGDINDSFVEDIAEKMEKSGRETWV